MSLYVSTGGSISTSVVIPCHDAEPYIAQAIGSVLEQSRVPEEIIVVDDSSTDRSQEIARSFGDPVRVVARRSCSASKTRNFGFSLSSGSRIMFLDADDVLGPFALESLATVLDKEDADIALCPWYRLEEESGRWRRRAASCRPRVGSEDPLDAWLTGWWHPPCSVLWSRDAYLRTGGWDERALVNNDGDLMMRALVYGLRLVETPLGSAYYRRLPTGGKSVSAQQLTRPGRESQIYVVEKIAHMLEEQGRLKEHREAVVQAFEMYEEKCAGEYPDLAQRCRQLSRRFSGRLLSRMSSRVKRSVAGNVSRVRHTLNRRIERAIALPVQRPSRRVASSEGGPCAEVTFGLRSAVDAASRDLMSTLLLPPETPSVSVIIPTFNRANVVGRAIDSVLKQTYQDFELLVVDDGSTDDTKSVIARYEDARMSYLIQPQNAGVSAARNRGMREARGEYIAFLDSDDEWMAEKLEKQVEILRQAPLEVGLVYTGSVTIRGDGTTRKFHPDRRGDVLRDLLLKNVTHSGGSSVLMRRNVVASAGFFDENIPAIEDYEYWIRVAQRYNIDFVQEPLVYYYDVEEQGRKSHHSRDNRTARDYLLRKHRNKLRCIGLEHRVLISSAQRCLWPQYYDRLAACRYAANALVVCPTDPDVYRLLLEVFTSQPIQARLGQWKRAVVEPYLRCNTREAGR